MLLSAYIICITGIDVHVDVEHGGKRMCRGRGAGRGRARGRGCCGMRGQSWGPECMARSASPKRKVPAQNKDQTSDGTKENPIVVDKVKDVAMEAKNVEASEAAEAEITSRTEQIVLTDNDPVEPLKEVDMEPMEPEKVVS